MASGQISKYIYMYSTYAPLQKVLKWFCSAEQNGHQS